jgi:DNA mismatch repair protein MutL
LLSDSRIAGQIFSTYWILELDDKIYIVDQHAAHERIIYEELVNNCDTMSQRLLSPEKLNLTPNESGLLSEHRAEFEGLGFEFLNAEGELYLEAIPVIMGAEFNKTVFMDILDLLAENARPEIDVKERIASLACKAAVKGNNRLDIREARAIINGLIALDNPFNCPHGRPVIVEITRYELEKRFKRV